MARDRKGLIFSAADIFARRSAATFHAACAAIRRRLQPLWASFKSPLHATDHCLGKHACGGVCGQEKTKETGAVGAVSRSGARILNNLTAVRAMDLFPRVRDSDWLPGSGLNELCSTLGSGRLWLTSCGCSQWKFKTPVTDLSSGF